MAARLGSDARTESPSRHAHLPATPDRNQTMTINASFRRMTSYRRRQLRMGLLFVSPWIVGLCAFTLYPIAASFYYSFTYYDVLTPARFIGLDNYIALFEDERFRQAVGNQVFFVTIAVPLTLVVALGLALLLNMKLRFRSVLRTIFYLPEITPLVATALIWSWIYNGQFGLLNGMLNTLGIPSVPWLTSEELVKPSLIAVSLWTSGGTMLIFLAALQDVPRHLYEAARIDGANRFQQFRDVTLPMLSPAIVFTLITGMISAFNYFALPWVMTQGGPAGASTFYPIYIYQAGFLFFKMGYASAMAWLMFLATVVCTVILFRTVGRWAYYAGQ